MRRRSKNKLTAKERVEKSYRQMLSLCDNKSVQSSRNWFAYDLRARCASTSCTLQIASNEFSTNSLLCLFVSSVGVAAANVENLRWSVLGAANILAASICLQTTCLGYIHALRDVRFPPTHSMLCPTLDGAEKDLFATKYKQKLTCYSWPYLLAVVPIFPVNCQSSVKRLLKLVVYNQQRERIDFNYCLSSCQ